MHSTPPQNMTNAIANASQQLYLSLMYVCICNAIKEDELREIARHGVTDSEAAYAVLGKTPQLPHLPRPCRRRDLRGARALRRSLSGARPVAARPFRRRLRAPPFPAHHWQ
ncbi:MAG: hypothetical protein WDN24_21135 [Sphingomonas sp.]